MFYKKIQKDIIVKKLLIIGTLSILVLPALFSINVNAQGLYFDTGVGVGKAWTKINGADVSDIFKADDDDFTQTAINYDLKLGYGPIANMPLYIVGTAGAVGHRIANHNSLNYCRLYSYMLGPGIIYYPIPLIQLAASIGYSWADNETQLPADMSAKLPTNMSKSKSGFAGDISAAIDLGPNNHGLLFGFKYFWTTNTLEISNVKQNQSGLFVFVKYAFRNKL